MSKKTFDIPSSAEGRELVAAVNDRLRRISATSESTTGAGLEVRYYVLFYAGILITGTDLCPRVFVIDSGPPVLLRADVKTAPVGAALTITIYRNASVWASISIGAGSTSASLSTDQLSTLLAPSLGDYWRVDVTQVGTTTAGSDLTITIGIPQGTVNVSSDVLTSPSTSSSSTSSGSGGSGGGGGSSSGGTVTSVSLALPAEFVYAAGPVTTSGTLGGTWNTQTANKFFASPDGALGLPSFRAIATGDLPSISLTSGVTGTLPIANGGTGATTAATARTNLGLGTAAVANVGDFLQPGNNFSDVSNANTARANLGLDSMSQQAVGGTQTFDPATVTTIAFTNGVFQYAS